MKYEKDREISDIVNGIVKKCDEEDYETDEEDGDIDDDDETTTQQEMKDFEDDHFDGSGQKGDKRFLACPGQKGDK